MDKNKSKPADKKKPEGTPPDGRGPRPTDPNELAKWIVERSTQKDESLSD